MDNFEALPHKKRGVVHFATFLAVKKTLIVRYHSCDNQVYHKACDVC